MACDGAGDAIELAVRLRQQIRILAADLARDETRPGFSVAEWRALSELARLTENDEVSLTELADRAGISKASASRTVHRLAAAGLVGWRTVADNLRLHAIGITPLGRRIHHTTQPSDRSGARGAIDRLPTDDLARAVRILDACLNGREPIDL